MTQAHKQQHEAPSTFALSSDGKLAITPSETSSQHDFDYLGGQVETQKSHP
jgi:hypothetical protein